MSIRADADRFIFADTKPTSDDHAGLDDGLLLPAVRPDDGLDDGLLLPAVQLDHGLDDGLLLPAVRMDDGLLLPY